MAAKRIEPPTEWQTPASFAGLVKPGNPERTDDLIEGDIDLVLASQPVAPVAPETQDQSTHVDDQLDAPVVKLGGGKIEVPGMHGLRGATEAPVIDLSDAPDPRIVDEQKSKVEAFLEQFLAQDQAPAQPNPVDTILTLLSEAHLHALTSIAQRTGRPVEEIIAGVISSAGDQGTLGELSMKPHWSGRTLAMHTGGLLGSSMSRQQLFRQCEGCGHTFEPLPGRYDQRFCCNNCGKIAAGYRDDAIPHSEECKTEAWKALRTALEMSKRKQKPEQKQAA